MTIGEKIANALFHNTLQTPDVLANDIDSAIADLRHKLVERLEGERMVTPCHQDADKYFNLAVNACIDAACEIMGQ